jgi:hypothetical protein
MRELSEIPAPGTYPSPALLRRWKSMPPWQAKRARAAWWRENGQQDGHAAPSQAPALAPSAPDSRVRTRRRLTTEELERRVRRRAELDDPAFNGTVTEEDLAIASPSTVTRLMNAGVLERDLGGPPPQRQPGSRR